MRRTFKTGLITATFALLAASASWAGENDAKYRHSVMEALGAQFGAIVMLFTNRVDRPGALQLHADALALTAQTLGSLFPEGSEGGQALPIIWEEPEQVAEAAKKSTESAMALAEAVRGGNKGEIAAAFRAAGEGCKGCHERYKEEDD